MQFCNQQLLEALIFHLISMAIAGIATGLIARFLMPSKDNMGWIM